MDVRAFAIDDESTGLFEAPNLTGSPERRLLLAILERAILDFVGNEEKEVEASREWIFGDLRPRNFNHFSFPWLCRELDLDIDGVVSKIRAMPRRGNSRIAPWYFNKNNAQPVKASSSGKEVGAY